MQRRCRQQMTDRRADYMACRRGANLGDGSTPTLGGEEEGKRGCPCAGGGRAPLPLLAQEGRRGGEGDSTVRREQFQGLRDGVMQHVELPVHRDPKRLERLGGCTPQPPPPVRSSGSGTRRALCSSRSEAPGTTAWRHIPQTRAHVPRCAMRPFPRRGRASVPQTRACAHPPDAGSRKRTARPTIRSGKRRSGQGLG